jgi:ADP-heptose:LPS heptosyltransferase
MCTPAIRAFKEAFPDCKLDFLTELPEVLQGNPHLSSVIHVDSSKHSHPIHQLNLIRKIRNAGYDLVVDFFANPRSAYYAFLSGAETRLGFGFGHRKWAYNLVPAKSTAPVYAATDRLKLLGAIGITSSDPRLEFYPSDQDRRKAGELIALDKGTSIVTISPVSRRAFNRWPLEKYARLGDLLASKADACPVILAGPGEESIADEVAKLMTAAHPIVPRISGLGLLGAVLEKAGLHIGNDNGPKHIAVACGIPTITIFGPHSHISWTYPDQARHLWILPSERCENCDHQKHSCNAGCIKRIPVEAVWEKARSMMRSLPAFESASRRI